MTKIIIGTDDNELEARKAIFLRFRSRRVVQHFPVGDATCVFRVKVFNNVRRSMQPTHRMICRYEI